jgi:hypothetical protein
MSFLLPIFEKKPICNQKINVINIGSLNYLKATNRSHSPRIRLNRLIVVKLKTFRGNEGSRSEYSEILHHWENGSNAALLKPNQRVLITAKNWLPSYHITFLAMLVFMQEISGWKNCAFSVSVVVVLLTFMLWVHAHFLLDAAIKMEAANTSFWERISSTSRSFAIGICGGSPSPRYT